MGNLMAHFNLNDYETVDARIHRFYEKYPNGRIITDLVETRLNEIGQPVQFIFKAEAYRDLSDPVPSATGYAEEILGSNPVNRTSALENAETSSIGRCLANLSFSPKGARPSQEEMQKAERTKSTAPKKTLTEAIEEAKPKIARQEKINTLKKEAYAKAQFYKLTGASADQFLIKLAGVNSYDKIDWYEVSLISREQWQRTLEAWNMANDKL
jgi:hypothetical protein